ncbi:hypothetical protein [Rhizorhapis suberifaciens]|uniref:Uncharacterized protein n=1 Tax=Rhizorhapis suberifaciens TaxID=13656 RepID=A0A840HTJ8_9SPHN|nr:hypothetical protein [Rhizorhapis suberifaciens]MBB4641021.1 hypothetical protein [Rhizorhapis suberifaciens]
MFSARVAGYAAAGLGLFGLAFLVWSWPGLKARAEAGAAYGARIGCSCRYVQGRPIESCEEDMEPGMEMVMLDDQPDRHSVTANVPLIARRTARLRPGYGCVLD